MVSKIIYGDRFSILTHLYERGEKIVEKENKSGVCEYFGYSVFSLFFIRDIIIYFVRLFQSTHI